MADDPESQAQPEGGAEPAEETQETPEQTAPEAEEKAESPDQAQAEPEAEGEVKSERGQKRVQALANKAKEAEKEAKTLRQQMDSLQDLKKQDGEKVTELPEWLKQDQPSLQGELTQDQLDQYIAQKADQLVQLRMAEKDRRDQVVRNYDQDIRYLEREYEDAFDSEDPDLQKSMEVMVKNFQAAAKADPTVRFKDFAEPILKARSDGVEQGKESASATLAEQKKSSAVKPKSQSSKQPSSEEQLATMLKTGEITAEEAMKKYPDLLPSE